MSKWNDSGMPGSARNAALAVVLAATAAGCGAAHRAAPPPPKLPHDLAAQLATLSDDVAAQLQSRNECAALAAARRLETQTVEAVNRGQVPVPLQQPLRKAADDLANRIHCTPPPQPPEEHGKGKGDQHGKHKGHDGGGD
jgi:hypothetical protein